ncbi:3-carboxy-cis,cis-muconate cycloisomerase [Phytoactinopolyspora halotolerans]|uniref:3-carboxy-cis,cis-muconate cycloisomerase n=1 Tax=Phytoactinopolyspora halotolerans TaxID=1981512 RepID=A0A6L9SCI0_9ACTN|nr:3-carboxy-cis,cis-muconate cycloisomerase [Phytoactinopolyspora halotolerans]NEE02936.1 3-carboxy-cis,cis-muconate cycloisomerase [Phytoactinopolyspora halotolerans]
MAGLLEALDGDPAVDREVGDGALVRALLDVEAALARALARAGLVSDDAAAAVAEAASTLDVDAEELGRRAVAAGNPVVPLVRDLAAAVPEHAQDAVHRGATSQDILDTALQLLARRALEPVLQYLRAAGDAAARLARDHRRTVMVARTLGQPAQPTTFGLRAANWLAGLDAANAELTRIRDEVLAVQLGGAAGTLAGYDAGPADGRGSEPLAAGVQVMAHLADELGLADPGVPWHTERSRVQTLGSALGVAVAACGKVATDVILQSQGEIAEVAEGAPGGSSAMPHKRNPVASVLVVAAARRSPGLVGTLLASGLHEQDRATGSWHAEWAPLRELLRLSGGAAAHTASVLDGLDVDPVVMRRNLDAAAPGVFSESLAAPLIPVLGRAAAQDAVRAALDEAPGGGLELVAVLRHDPAVADAVDEGELAARLDPVHALGAADAVIDRHLRAHDRQRVVAP